LPRLHLILLILCLLSRHPLLAGQNAGVDIGLGITTPPCNLTGGDLIEFFVAARNMSDARQVKLEFSWQPADAVAAVKGSAAGAAETFIVPGPPQIEGNRGEFGMATFSSGLAGEGILARLGFELAAHVGPDTPIDIRVEQVSLGPSFTERDTIRPLQALALGNYCDADGQVVEQGLFVRPREARAFFSPAPTGRIADSSSGEVLIGARFLHQGKFRRDQLVVWTIDNQGTAPVYVLGAQQVLRVESGGVQEGFSRSDARGDAYLLLDAESGPSPLPSIVELTACSEGERQRYCAAAGVTWDVRTTAVTADRLPLPARLRLEQNFPNPFNAATTIPFSVPPEHADALRLDVVDLKGQIVDVLIAGRRPPGRHLISWAGRSRRGFPLASGLYFCRLRSGTEERVRPMLLLR